MFLRPCAIYALNAETIEALYNQTYDRTNEAPLNLNNMSLNVYDDSDSESQTEASSQTKPESENSTSNKPEKQKSPRRKRRRSNKLSAKEFRSGNNKTKTAGNRKGSNANSNGEEMKDLLEYIHSFAKRLETLQDIFNKIDKILAESNDSDKFNEVKDELSKSVNMQNMK